MYHSINDLIRAGIMCADYMVVLSSPEIHSVEHESLADAENIDAFHKIARFGIHFTFIIHTTSMIQQNVLAKVIAIILSLVVFICTQEDTKKKN